MKTAFILSALAAAMILGAPVRGDDVLPQPAAPKRYEKLAGHSPFAPPTAPVSSAPTPTPTPGPSWSDNLTVTSLMQNGGVYTATLAEKDSSDHYIIRSDEVDKEHQMKVASVVWASTPDAIKVTISKGNQLGDVHFDPSASSGDGSGTTPPAAPVPQPVNRAVLPGGIRPPPGGPPQRLLPGQQPNNIQRMRSPIRAAPPPGGPGRPIINPPNPMRNVTPVKPARANDDDDDN